MKIGLAYFCRRTSSRRFTNFVVFEADADTATDSDRSALLLDLTERARAAGLSIEKSALVFPENGRVMFYGTPDLVEYLTYQGIPHRTHYLTL